jgi:hypothetical protein
LITQTIDSVKVPVDLTGATVWMTAKRHYKDTDLQAVFQIKTPTDIILDGDPTTGRCVIIVPASATKDMVFVENVLTQELYFDIQVKTQLGVVQTVEVGKLTVSVDITNSIT